MLWRRFKALWDSHTCSESCGVPLELADTRPLPGLPFPINMKLLLPTHKTLPGALQPGRRVSKITATLRKGPGGRVGFLRSRVQHDSSEFPLLQRWVGFRGRCHSRAVELSINPNKSVSLVHPRNCKCHGKNSSSFPGKS